MAGIRLEAHSLIPWATNAETSFRALTKPLAPSPHLAAGLALGALKAAEKIAEKLSDEIPWLRAARTVTLLPGLLLTPVNQQADPGQDYDNQFAQRNHDRNQAISPSPTPDEIRLAELERALVAQSLTTQEEAELILLLAKVKGIHIQQIHELTSLSSAPAKLKSAKPYKNKKKLLGNGPGKRKSKRTEYLGRTPGKSSATGKGVIKRMESEGKIQADSLQERQVLGPDGQWHAIKKTDMGHGHDAVNWWNAEGRKHGAKSTEVRKWMLDPDNYELEPTSINRSKGAKLKDRYLPPLK